MRGKVYTIEKYWVKAKYSVKSVDLTPMNFVL
jgi:hypothetical protein